MSKRFIFSTDVLIGFQLAYQECMMLMVFRLSWSITFLIDVDDKDNKWVQVPKKRLATLKKLR